jgi:hypothetical protein
VRAGARTLTPTLSRFAVEGANECDRSGGVPSTAKREKVGVRVCGSVYLIILTRGLFQHSSFHARGAQLVIGTVG